jgi:hypothetical protein
MLGTVSSLLQSFLADVGRSVSHNPASDRRWATPVNASSPKRRSVAHLTFILRSPLTTAGAAPTVCRTQETPRRHPPLGAHRASHKLLPHLKPALSKLAWKRISRGNRRDEIGTPPSQGQANIVRTLALSSAKGHDCWAICNNG